MSQEVVYLRLRTHPKMLIGPALFTIAVAAMVITVTNMAPATVGPANVDLWMWLLFAVVAVIAMVPVTVRWWFTTFTVTSRAVRSRSGIIWRSHVDLPINRISQVNAEQGLLDRIFGCGTLNLADPSPESGIQMVDVPHVDRVQRLIDDLVSGNEPEPDGT